jgi:ubiquinone/menaquinone biosynthesis C-methylase UbiE
MMAGAEKSFMREVRRRIAGGAQGRVLEIGAGTGANFPYYTEAAVSVVAVEPDPFMARRARERARKARVPIDLRQAPAEVLPFGDETFDTVVATLVLCSVRDPVKALAEIRRVLRPGGQFRFYEHVRYEHPFGAFWQDIATPLWRWAGAGCHPNRDTGRAIREAGFVIQEMELTKPVPVIPPMGIARPHIRGVALRP